MKYFSKIIITLFILTFACFGLCSVVRADNTVTTANQTTQNQTTTPSTQPTSQISTTVSTSSSAENEIFSIPNIINILLIAVGIVLILLALAIFTRLKK
ncbi:MAG: hypothetical protein IKE91_06560 [Clostridia bacterium]|nr:hypothetical protein [Clostridia bacterium]